MEFLFTVKLAGLPLIEVAAFVLGVGNLWLIVRQNIWNWPVGLALVTLYFWIFGYQRIYASMGLQVFFFALQIYGWYQWLHGGAGGGARTVTRLDARLARVLLGISAAGTAALAVLLVHTADPAPIPDSAATVLSLAAQWMMARKILEHWLVWIAVDVLTIGFSLYTGLYPTAALYTVFLVLCVRGFGEWRRTLPAPGPPTPAMGPEGLGREPGR
ncbi:MAG: nicotinamide mononucleotide transporter [Acidobacteria bacterium]|nr:nicotinamide mononucleotide transporter [Acidobacteriota bacterium]